MILAGPIVRLNEFQVKVASTNEATVVVKDAGVPSRVLDSLLHVHEMHNLGVQGNPQVYLIAADPGMGAGLWERLDGLMESGLFTSVSTSSFGR